ncbi:MAG: hypothetical protein WCE62_06955 [Polyangiales bacterium]
MGAIREAALLYGIVALVAIGCGDSDDLEPYVAEGKVELPCSGHSVYRCGPRRSSSYQLAAN